MSKHIILFLAANPLETARIAVDREVRAIQEQLERNHLDHTFELVTRWAAQPADLLDGLSKLRPTVVHFSGHGTRSGTVNRGAADGDVDGREGTHGLLFEGADGRPQVVSAAKLQEIFAAARAPVRLVVLNASYSDVVAEALMVHVDCAVAFAGSMADETARTFMVGFYRGLVTCQPIESCFHMGCARITVEGLTDAARPRLVVREAVDAARLAVVDRFDQQSATPMRDIHGVGAPAIPESGGRSLISVIGIDRYQHTARWQPLAHAVSDARGAAAVFKQLGFVHATPPLLDEAATSNAIQSLVTDELTSLGSEDSLVLFYAGHGGNREHRVGDHAVTTGYLIPVDGHERVATWVELDGWLRAVARLPAKHILVILDACHSGIALDPARGWRGTTSQTEPLSTLKARRSRRIVTSALSDQRAMDGGPYPGHSLFTGCLIEALTYGLRQGEELITTGSELGAYLQRRVASYPHTQQTPDFGTLSFDDRGEMVLSLLPDGSPLRREPAPSMLSHAPRVHEDKFQGDVKLENGGTGSSAIDLDDRLMFWAAVEQALDPPTTTRGARVRRLQSFRHGAFAGNVRLGVVANGNGAMRVHLWSTHRDQQRTLQAVEHEVAAESIVVPPQLGVLATRPAPNGEMLYLEFAWQRSGPYLPELDRVRACIRWFVGAAKNRFG